MDMSEWEVLHCRRASGMVGGRSVAQLVGQLSHAADVMCVSGNCPLKCSWGPINPLPAAAVLALDRAGCAKVCATVCENCNEGVDC